MTTQSLKRDPNYVPTLGGVTDDASADVRILKVDPVTDRLKVNVTVTGGVDNTPYDIKVDEYDATTTYVGEAAVGSTDGDPVWRIKQIKVDGTVTTVFYAEGNPEFSYLWSLRTGYEYVQ